MDGHSRLVGWLKVALPLAALALLSTLFLVSRSINPGDAIPFSEVDIADRLREPRMTEPAFAGVTEDGATITLTADEMRPGQGRGAAAQTLRARIETPDGGDAALSAGSVTVDEGGRVLVLGEGVLVSTSTGYEFRTEAMSLALDRTGARSAGGIEGFGPPGRLTAGGAEITRAGEAGDYVLVFNNGVRLIYQPGKP
ncbi:MAG: hypothetical protein LBE86_14570 [Gemmobacter sp.]|jgi:lipopolysaccharide export system protein LptC|nr:hypothetical protein [Gemmobacter sp.]